VSIWHSLGKFRREWQAGARYGKGPQKGLALKVEEVRRLEEKLEK
jgi:hypothetical protein